MFNHVAAVVAILRKRRLARETERAERGCRRVQAIALQTLSSHAYQRNESGALMSAFHPKQTFGVPTRRTGVDLIPCPL